jgi:hypothetical protein
MKLRLRFEKMGECNYSTCTVDYQVQSTVLYSTVQYNTVQSTVLYFDFSIISRISQAV